MNKNKIIGRLLILDHIDADEAIILLGGLAGSGETEEEEEFGGVDEGYYVNEPIEPLSGSFYDVINACTAGPFLSRYITTIDSATGAIIMTIDPNAVTYTNPTVTSDVHFLSADKTVTSN